MRSAPPVVEPPTRPRYRLTVDRLRGGSLALGISHSQRFTLMNPPLYTLFAVEGRLGIHQI